MVALSTCPICDKANLQSRELSRSRQDKEWRISCADCGFTGPAYHSEAVAAVGWESLYRHRVMNRPPRPAPRPERIVLMKLAAKTLDKSATAQDWHALRTHVLTCNYSYPITAQFLGLNATQLRIGLENRRWTEWQTNSIRTAIGQFRTIHADYASA